MNKINLKKIFEKHWGGKIQTKLAHQILTKEELAIFYTPGVAEVCKAIAKDPQKAIDYTIKKNTVAVLTNGTAVLGLGDIGPKAALPVMEGKAMLLKALANVDAFPICIPDKEPVEVIKIAKSIAPVFGGINLEDISAPSCFEIEERLTAELDIPVFHDDQHGTAIVTLAALYNALKIVNKKIEDVEIVVSGAGAAAIACSRLFIEAGVKNVILCDRAGAIYKNRQENMNSYKKEIAKISNLNQETGTLKQVLKNKDLFIGLSGPNLLEAEDLKVMNKDPIVFAMSNPVPEIEPEKLEGLAAVVATGRSDYPNQINNVLAFPGVFRGLLDSGIKTVTPKVKITAAKAIASIVKDKDLNSLYIIPDALNQEAPQIVAQAIAQSVINKKKQLTA